MNKITILTISPEASFVEQLYLRFRKYLKKHFFGYGGPNAVLESLIRGLDELKLESLIHGSVTQTEHNRGFSCGQFYRKEIQDIKIFLEPLDAVKPMVFFTFDTFIFQFVNAVTSAKNAFFCLQKLACKLFLIIFTIYLMRLCIKTGADFR